MVCLDMLRLGIVSLIFETREESPPLMKNCWSPAKNFAPI